MSDDLKPHDNFTRLLERLQEGSLAAKLVSAYAEQRHDQAMETLKVVILGRLEQVRHECDKD
jgi:RecB family exonuclease